MELGAKLRFHISLKVLEVEYPMNRTMRWRDTRFPFVFGKRSNHEDRINPRTRYILRHCGQRFRPQPWPKDFGYPFHEGWYSNGSANWHQGQPSQLSCKFLDHLAKLTLRRKGNHEQVVMVEHVWMIRFRWSVIFMHDGKRSSRWFAIIDTKDPLQDVSSGATIDACDVTWLTFPCFLV